MMNIANHFRSLDDLIRALDREQTLLKEMFYNRKTLSFRCEVARELARKKEESLDFLRRYGVIRIDGDFVELEEVYLKFFEDVLVVNEEINVASVKQYIDNLNDAIEYYLSENRSQRKEKYLGDVKRMLRNVALSILRSVIDLKRNIDSTYKNEPTFAVKRKKLEKLDEKRRDISVFIKECERLIDDRQTTFFLVAMDVQLRDIVTDVKYQLHEAYHNLIELDRQIISYLNLIEYQSRLVQKIQKLKHLRDQLLLDSQTDIKAKMAATDPVWMEPRPRYQLKVSLSMLRNTDDGLLALRNLAAGKDRRRLRRSRIAEPLSEEEMSPGQRELALLDIGEIKDAYMATGDNLFHFVMNYSNHGKPLDEETRLVLFCQIATQYIDDLNITGQYQAYKNLEYPLIYSKR